jgi:predicted DNA-binding antitoxin AbrB/MazE fold protein
VSTRTITIEAVYVGGVLRPAQPLPLSSDQQITITVQLPDGGGWPGDVADIYREIAEEDRRLAAAMLGNVRSTWPAGDLP